MRYMVCFVTLALGGYLNSITLAKDVNGDIKSFNADRKRLNIVKKLPEWIKLHSDGKQLSRKTVILHNSYKTYTFCNFLRVMGIFSKLYATTITVLFAGSCVAIGLAMLMVEVQLVEYFGIIYCELQNEFYWLSIFSHTMKLI